MANRAKIRQFLTLSFFAGLLAQKFAERLFWVACNDQAFLLRAALRFLFGFLHVGHNDKLSAYRLGLKRKCPGRDSNP